MTAPKNRTRRGNFVPRDRNERREFLRRAKKGENYHDIVESMKLPRSTGFDWLRQAILVGAVDPKLHPYIGRRVSGLGTRPVMMQKREEFEKHIRFGGQVERSGHKVGVAKSTAERWYKEMLAAGLVRASVNPIAYDELKQEAKTYLKDFAKFREHVLGRTNNPPWAVRTAEMLLELYHSEADEYAVVNVAPGLGKSTLITHDFVCWAVTLERAMGKEPTILLGHKTSAKAVWYVKRLRQTFTLNRRLIELYGRFQPDAKRMAPWSTEQLLVEPLDWAGLGEKEPTISAGSYDSDVLSGRYGLVVWDDLIDKGNSSNAEQRAELVRKWQQELETRLNQGGLLILSNARYGPEDLSWFVAQQTDPENFDEQGLERPLYHRIRFKVHDETKCRQGENPHTGPWPNGCLLDPEMANFARIHRARIQHEGRFELVWQQEDSDAVGFLAQRAWFEGGPDRDGAIAPGCFDLSLRFGQVMSRPDHERPALSIVTVDPGTARYWAIQHFLVFADKTHQLYRAKRAVMQAPELLYEDSQTEGYTGVLEDWWRASADEGTPFSLLVVEENNAQRWLRQYPFFQRWCGSRGVAMIPHNTGSKNKPDPERGVEMNSMVYRHGRLVLPYGGYEERLIADQYRKEACSWPEGSTDDLVIGHWFLTHRLEQLLAGVQLPGAFEAPSDAPSFARVKVPRWAAKVAS